MSAATSSGSEAATSERSSRKVVRSFSRTRSRSACEIEFCGVAAVYANARVRLFGSEEDAGAE